MTTAYTNTPVENTILEYTTVGGSTYTQVDNLLSVKPPGLKAEKVDTWGINSTMKTSRAGKIPGVPDVTFKVQWDGAKASHPELLGLVGGANRDWKVIYNDGLTTPAFHKFTGYLLESDFDEEQEEANVEVQFTLVPVTVPVFTPGVP